MTAEHIAMTAAQRETLSRAVDLIKGDDRVEGIVFGGSIAHGYSTERSDIDVLIVVTEEEYARRAAEGEITYYNGELATYEGGYIDGKFISRSFIQKVAQKGSEPARFAFCDAAVVYDRTGLLPGLVARAGRYPIERRASSVRRFLAQVEGWAWYFEQGAEKESRYLMGYAGYKVILFAARLLFAVNARLYPYHKWMFRALESLPDRPEGLISLLRAEAEGPTPGGIARIAALSREAAGEFAAEGWGNDFVRDVELTWLDGEASVEEM